MPVRPLLALLVVLALPHAPHAVAAPDEAAAARAIVTDAVRRRDWATVVAASETYGRRWPLSPPMLYNVACAHAMLGRAGDAEIALMEAVRAGFRDFDHLARDPDLASIRDSRVVQAILESAERRLEDEAQRALDAWRDRFGREGYRFELDREHRIAYATALDPLAHDEMVRMLKAQHDHLAATLFVRRELPYYVLVAIPTPAHAEEVLGAPEIGGRYEHAQRRLVARNTGASLRHEFVHALHYAHMERLGLDAAHPIWIQEGLAALYEDYELRADGSIAFLPNERTNVVRNLARAGRLTPWEDLVAMPAAAFMNDATQLYPQVRAIFEYLAAEGALERFYESLVNTWGRDRTGRLALEHALRAPLSEAERAFRRWVARRPVHDDRIEPGEAWLGVEGAPNGSNDGVLVTRVHEGSAADRAGVRVGDAVVALDERPIRSIVELQRAVSARRPGERVTLRVRRGGGYLVLGAELRAYGTPARIRSGRGR